MNLPPRMSAWENEIAGKLSRYPDLQTTYRTCFESTMLSAMTELDGTTYVLTGDIPAMWLRDSSAQATPYLPVAAQDAETARILKNMLARQFFYINLDPYANAFNGKPDGGGHKDDTGFDSDWIWERKYEIDSLCYPFWFADRLYAATGDISIFDDAYIAAARRAVSTLQTELHHSRDSAYRFIRTGEYAHDTLDNGGRGAPAVYTGMTWSAFRPSDDKCRYPYFIPGNLFAAHTLNLLARTFTDIGLTDDALKMRKLSLTVRQSVHEHGIVNTPQFGKIYAYETDGEGNFLFADDANVPSLLALPYLGCCKKDDPLYQNTRRFVLSEQNPYFYRGTFGEGVGSPHTPDGYIWHISIILRALTATDMSEVAACFRSLRRTHAGTFRMHESFDKDAPERFTRPWFAWADSLFAVLVHTYIDRIDDLLD